ncbi:Glutamate synthase [NADPH] small chain [hydrothermal vent metagenome]|uniref:Glutamate synthase [NADPH] small chain n=1 Tax=hydrothermal vent metagenome TaxID=652676 RepID=A0A3B0XWG2_9ZZZZ
MPRRYSLAVQLFSVAAFSLAFFGWLNEAWLFWFENPIWLNRYTEYAIILGFGIWRIAAEQNSYTRRRLIILVFMVTVFWWLIPWLYPVYEPYVGFLWAQPVFPSLHVPGTLTFFLILGLVFLFGRRIICGFGCPCVGIRETVGFPFRKKTLRSKWTWRLRHSKWFFFAYYVGIMVATQFPPNSWTVSFVGSFYLIVVLTYFGSFFLAPMVGNRFYCRYLCPYGATFGLLNHAGFYNIKMDKDKCNDCQRCEQVCDMGIPVWEQGKQAGQITALEDCMGCARCVVSCPTDALEIRDVRNLFRPKLVQNASYLLKRKQPEPLLRQEPPQRPAVERLGDWTETTTLPALAQVQAQATRCLDCGVPGCINACPLLNRIPEWLEAVAAGQFETAAEISHATSNLPEVCGSLCPQHRLCEGSCTKAKEPDGAVTIGAIERYLTDMAFEQGWQPQQAVRRNGKRIAIVGAGPAGLACADQLNKAGCDVTVYDKQPVIGGLLASGVPPFKLDKALLVRRHQLLAQQGIHFRLGEDVNDVLLDELLGTHDAIFLGTGTQTSRDLQLPGQQLPGVTDALTYLQQVNREPDTTVMADKHVLVIGAGDSAMDCARSAVRQGAAEVTLAYRKDEQAMRASPKEKQAALEEGVVFRMECAPVQVLGDKAVTGLRFNKPDGGQETIACDVLILAVGQVPQPPAWLDRFDVQTDERGIIRVDENGRTSNTKFYAGGDNTNGPDLVVTAIAAGRQAARGILDSFRPTRVAQESIRSLLKAPEKQPDPGLVAARNVQ